MRTTALDSASAAHKCGADNETFEASVEDVFLRRQMQSTCAGTLFVSASDVLLVSAADAYLFPLDNLSAVRKILQTAYLAWSIGSIVHAGAQA